MYNKIWRGVTTGLVLSALVMLPSANALEQVVKPDAAVTRGSNLQGGGVAPDADDVNVILSLINDLMKSSNAHDIDGVLGSYSPRFVSGDNMTLDQIKKLIQETWSVFPDIRYQTETLEVRVSGNWATVESIDSATATAKVDPVAGNQLGRLESRSRGLLYLHRIGTSWEILSDYTLYERAVITYGNLGALELDLSTPEQVFAGEPYSARVSMDVPEGVLAIATISREPLVYPQVKPRDKFRSLSSDKNTLERIFSANKNNTNEVVTATVGFTQIAQDSEDRPTIQLNGIATIVKRVNILPKSQFRLQQPTDDLVRVSADGDVDLTESAASSDDEE